MTRDAARPAREFVDQRRGFQLVELASGWVMQSAPDVASWVDEVR